MRTAIAVLITLATLTACGKKGPLVLPDARTVNAPVSAPAQVPTTPSAQ